MSLVVCDASTVVAALLRDIHEQGDWAAQQLRGAVLVGPALLPFEVSNVLRRHELAGRASADRAARGHVDLLGLRLQLYPYAFAAQRTWELRASVTAYDASYVALAEALAVPLVTLDRRLARAPGLRCEVLVP